MATAAIDGGKGPSAERRILRAALAVFAGAGFAGASTREIARRAGVHQPAIAYHFGSKEALWRAAAGAVFADFIAHLREIERAQPGDDEHRLRALSARFVAFVAANPEWVVFVLDSTLQPGALSDWLVDTWFRPMVTLLVELMTGHPFPAQGDAGLARAISMMGMLAGSTTVFVQRDQLRTLAGIDTLDPAFIAAHADHVARALAALIEG